MKFHFIMTITTPNRCSDKLLTWSQILNRLLYRQKSLSLFLKSNRIECNLTQMKCDSDYTNVKTQAHLVKL